MIKPESLPDGLLRESLTTATLNLSLLIKEAVKRGWSVELRPYDGESVAGCLNVQSCAIKVHEKGDYR